MSIDDIEDWINNDEALYLWWLSMKNDHGWSMRKFIRENEQDLVQYINKAKKGNT